MRDRWSRPGRTVRRWLNGRIPYPANRAALANLVGVAEADLWPDLLSTSDSKMNPMAEDEWGKYLLALLLPSVRHC